VPATFFESDSLLLQQPLELAHPHDPVVIRSDSKCKRAMHNVGFGEQANAEHVLFTRRFLSDPVWT
jgi:hypothetical protein